MRALIVATGPSLTRADVDYWSRGRWVYGVSNAYDGWCEPDVLYACDKQWWDVHEPRTRHLSSRWTASYEAAGKYGLNHVCGQYSSTLFFDASGQGIVYGGNSGFQALNLAYLHGIRDAVLLGFDCGQAANQPSHCFGEHPRECDNPKPYNSWLAHWRKAAPAIKAAGMRVRNASRVSAIDCFERVTP